MFKYIIPILLFSSISYGVTRVAVIDSGFDKTKSKATLCKTGHYDFVKNKPMVGTDEIQHGTVVANAIHSYATNYCLVIYKIYPSSKTNTKITVALYKAIVDKVDIINLSFGGPGKKDTEYNALSYVLSKGVKIFVSAGNDGINLDRTCDVYPVCYKDLDLIRVGSNTPQISGTVRLDNYGKILNTKEDWCFGSRCGTSFSTAIATGKYIRSLNEKTSN